jgi:Lar family restriction alleviation protein
MTGERLKPCPFCGSTDQSSDGWFTAKGIGHQVECRVCKARGPFVLDAVGCKTPESEWNRREG